MAEEIKNTQYRNVEQEIKSAVSSSPITQESQSNELEMSMINQQAPQNQTQDYSYQNQSAYQGQDYQYQDPSQQGAPQQYGLSSDTMSEIAEDVVADKLFTIKKELDKIIDFRNTVQAKMEYLDERLKRIEKVIDRLQLSVLQKVGEYVASTEDIKKELEEMQKTFKVMHKK